MWRAEDYQLFKVQLIAKKIESTYINHPMQDSQLVLSIPDCYLAIPTLDLTPHFRFRFELFFSASTPF